MPPVKRITRRSALGGAGATLALPAAARQLPRGIGVVPLAAAAGTPPTNVAGSALPKFDPLIGVSGLAPGTPSTASSTNIVSGTVTVRTIGYIASSPPGTTLTLQWMIARPATKDIVPLSGYITESPQPFHCDYSWDTTTVPNGTYVIFARLIDSDFALYTRLQSAGGIFIVRNGGTPVNGAQTVPVTVTAEFPASYPGRPDFVDYTGTPWLPNATHVLPSPTTGFIPPLAGDVAGRVNVNWRADDPGEPRAYEYEYNFRFATTPTGNVFVGETNPEQGNWFDDATYLAAQRRGGIDGGRCNATLDAFITYVAAPDGLSWYGCELGGRILRVDFDGTVTTVYGIRFDRTKLPFDIYDGSISDTDIDTRFETVGTGGLEVGGALDLCFDPRNADILYFVNVREHYIAKIVLSTGVGSVYAGISGTSGFTNSATATLATFNNPTSIIMSDGTGNGGAIGTMYVVDNANNCIRMITSPSAGVAGTVSTLVGKQTPPSDATVAAAPATYSPPGTVTGYANIWMVAPFTIRWTSARNIIVTRNLFQRVSEINLSAQSDRLIGYYGSPAGTTVPATISSDRRTWTWMDCDYAGACGPVNDIVMLVSSGSYSPGVIDAASNNWLFSLDGALSQSYAGNGSSNLLHTGSPPQIYYIQGFGHYPWAFAFSRTQARIIGSGFANAGAAMMRFKVGTDPPFDPNSGIGFVPLAYIAGDNIARAGTVSGRGTNQFPWNSRPSFSFLRGSSGCGHLSLWGSTPGTAKNTFDDFMSTFPSTTPGDAGDVALANYIRSGMGGTVPRPEITGNDMRDLIYFIRRSTLAGSYPTPVALGPNDPDTTPPVITLMSASRVNSTTIHVNWTTDKPTIGFVAVGSPNQVGFTTPYCVFSDIETVPMTGGVPTYLTTHGMDVPGCPLTTPTHFSVVVKDMAGNCTHTADQTVA